MAEVPGHLLAQVSFQDGFGELFEQAVRPGQRQALLIGEVAPVPRLLRTARPSSSSRLPASFSSHLLAEHSLSLWRRNTDYWTTQYGLKPSPVAAR